MKSILISAGHGGTDPGVVVGSHKEADLARRLRNAIAEKLRARGAKVVTDGQALTNLPLKQALQLTRNAQICVEIHFNAAANLNATGTEALSRTPARPLAQSLCQAIGDATGLRLRGDKGWRPTDSGQHHRLAFCEAGGVILEVCFLTNLSDRQLFFVNESKVVDGLVNALWQEATRE